MIYRQQFASNLLNNLLESGNHLEQTTIKCNIVQKSNNRFITHIVEYFLIQSSVNTPKIRVIYDVKYYKEHYFMPSIEN